MTATAATATRPETSRGAFVAKLGAWLQLAQVIGIGGTVVGMTRAFQTLSNHGTRDPVSLSSAIGEVLIYAAIGVGLSLLGLVLIIIAITACRYRAGWMWRFLCFYSLLLISANACLMLIGSYGLAVYLPVAVFFLIFALAKKQEFICATNRPPLPSCYVLDDPGEPYPASKDA